MDKMRITDFDSIEITVKAYNTFPEGATEGLMSFNFAATDVTDDDDNPLGTVGGGPGVAIISIRGVGYFQIRHRDLWFAFQESLQKQETK